jgi:acetyl-CoA acyltransferase
VRSSPLTDAGREVLLVDAVRTPVGRGHAEKGWLADVHPVDLLEATYTALLDRTGMPAGDVDDLVIGCTSPIGAQSRNIARNAWLQGGYPVEVPATTLDRRCGSAQTAVTMGASLVASGTHDVVIAGGVEHMGRVPIDAMRTTEEPYGDPWPPKLRERFDFVHQGESAELIADRWDIGRDEMEALALRSHRLADAATREGRFAEEIVPLTVGGRLVDTDQGIRPGGDAASLAALKPPFRPDGRITAATSSQISDGASTVLLASRAACERYGLTPRARVLDQVTVGVDPIIMLTGPIPATQKLLTRTGLTMGDIDLSEVNEAFASVVLAWERELEPDMDTVNVNGGAMALGHPVGATGARLLTTLLHEMGRRDAAVGLVTMCCGGGLGTGTLLERVGP